MIISPVAFRQTDLDIGTLFGGIFFSSSDTNLVNVTLHQVHPVSVVL